MNIHTISRPFTVPLLRLSMEFQEPEIEVSGTICLAIFWGHIPLHSLYIGPINRHLKRPLMRWLWLISSSNTGWMTDESLELDQLGEWIFPPKHKIRMTTPVAVRHVFHGPCLDELPDCWNSSEVGDCQQKCQDLGKWPSLTCSAQYNVQTSTDKKPFSQLYLASTNFI